MAITTSRFCEFYVEKWSARLNVGHSKKPTRHNCNGQRNSTARSLRRLHLQCDSRL